MIDTKNELDLLVLLQKKLLSLELEFTDHIYRMRIIIEEIEKLQKAKKLMSEAVNPICVPEGEMQK